MATLVSRNEFNVYESADARFEAAARKLNLEEGLYRFLKYPNKEITVYIPVMLDNGQLDDVEMRGCKHTVRRREGRSDLRPHKAFERRAGAYYAALYGRADRMVWTRARCARS